MKMHPMAWLVAFVFAVILAVGLLGKGTLTGGAIGGMVPINGGTILSVVAALLGILVLIVAGFQQMRK
ncbi:MAG: hypothetical protein QW165_01750 [Candidatus Woesearchaeota archaeon]